MGGNSCFSSGKTKKNPNKNSSKALVASNMVLQQREGCRITLCRFQTELVVGATLDRSEPSPRFASNGIHTKSGADNLQGNGLRKGPGASQVPIRRGSQKPGSLKI